MTVSPITLHHEVPRDDLLLGVIKAAPVDCGPAPPALSAALDDLVASVVEHGENPARVRRTKLCRDILRNGRYKPTGRGKPASEYLLRAAGEGNFPRVNGPVDANNLVSLKHTAPISLWDLERAGSNDFEFRLGGAGDTYVFNPSGQEMKLDDLVTGYARNADGGLLPIVNPVKDSLKTKTTESSRFIAGCVYFPTEEGEAALKELLEDFQHWLRQCGLEVETRHAVVRCGASVTL